MATADMGKNNEKYINSAIVLATPHLGGGTTRHVHEMAEAWSRQGFTVLCVETYNRIAVVTLYEMGSADEENQLYYYIPQQYEEMVKHLKLYIPVLIHYHHLMFSDGKMLSLVDDLAVPAYLTLHDYFVVCPSIKLVTKQKIYCEEPMISICENCFEQIKANITALDLSNVYSISDWRKNMLAFMSRMEKIFVPSQDEKIRLKRYFTKLDFTVFENPEVVPIPEVVKQEESSLHDVRRIGVIGLISDEKGARIIEQCVQIIEKKRLNIQIVVFGKILRKINAKRQIVNVLGMYKEDEIYSLIQQEKIDFFWFPGQWPETYSYTLSIPIRLGKPIIASNLGAISQRIRMNNWGSVYDWKLSCSEICKLLIEFDYLRFAKAKEFFCIRNTSFPKVEMLYQNIKSQGIRFPDISEIHKSSLEGLQKIRIVNSYGSELRLIKKIPLPICWKIKIFMHMDYCWALRRIYEKIFKE